MKTANLLESPASPRHDPRPADQRSANGHARRDAVAYWSYLLPGVFPSVAHAIPPSRACRSIRARTLTAAATTAVALLTSAQTSIAQVPVGTSFSGSNSDLSALVPPHPSGAVAAEHFVEFVKGRWAVYRKSDGGLITSSTDAAFWTAAGVDTGTALLSYPRMIFDPNSKRWFASQIDVINGSTSN